MHVLAGSEGDDDRRVTKPERCPREYGEVGGAINGRWLEGD